MIKNLVIIMNFKHTYEKQSFYKDRNYAWLNCTDINGTNCYCDKHARQLIQKRIQNYSPYGIHFMDSGNFHYVSELWLEKIKEPFVLIVFDHHPDMQPSLFEGLLSCGNWVKNTVDHNPFIHKAVIIGAKQELINQVENKYTKKVSFYSENTLEHKETWQKFAVLHIDYPLYISIDKDVLSTKEVLTDWDQGVMTLTELKQLLLYLMSNHKVLGVDICGEYTKTTQIYEDMKTIRINNHANKELLEFLASRLSA